MASEKDEALFLEAVIENIPDMIFVKDAAELRFVRFNRAGEELLGIPRAELIGKNDFDFFPAAEARAFTEKDREVLDRGVLHDIPEEPIHTRTRGTRTLHTKKVPIFDADGAPLFLLGISEDITDRQRALAEAREARLVAEEASRAKTQFLAFMSHEVRTPLNGILGMAQLLETTALSTQQREMVEGVVSSGRRLLKIASDLLDLSRVDVGKMVFETAPFDVVRATRDVVSLFSARARARGVELVVEVDAGVPGRVEGDAGRVQQVLTNLVDNAARFTDRGRISVRVGVPADGRLRFEVDDTGVGIAAAELGNIFDRPFEAGRSLRGGTGLGLSICRRLVALMGGTLGVTSTIGQGSRFWFELPLKTASAQAAAASDATGARAVPRGRVLVVEDDPVSRRVAVLMLEHLGQQVIAIEDGTAAVSLVAGGGFHLVVMDCNLPGISGVDVAAAIRASGAKVPVIALAADIDDDARRRCLEAGMLEVLNKPVDVDVMADALRRFARDDSV